MKPLRDILIVRLLKQKETVGDTTIVRPDIDPDSDLPIPPKFAHGEIIAIGPQVSKFSVGQRVMFQANSPESVEFDGLRTVKQDYILALLEP